MFRSRRLPIFPKILDDKNKFQRKTTKLSPAERTTFQNQTHFSILFFPFSNKSAPKCVSRTWPAEPFKRCVVAGRFVLLIVVIFAPFETLSKQTSFLLNKIVDFISFAVPLVTRFCLCVCPSHLRALATRRRPKKNEAKIPSQPTQFV